MSNSPNIIRWAIWRHDQWSALYRETKRERDEAREIAQKYEDRYFSAISERDEARSEFTVAQKLNAGLAESMDQWRECAEGLGDAMDSGDIYDRSVARQELERLREASK